MWCWQQNPEHRPTAGQIIEATSSEQFPRLLDGIRACNVGQVGGASVCSSNGVALEWLLIYYNTFQVTSSCVRMTTPPSYGWRGRRILSPSTISLNSRPSFPQSPQPISYMPRSSLDDKGFPQSTEEAPPITTELGDSESSSPSGPSPILSPQRNSIDEPRSKYVWSPRISDQVCQCRVVVSRNTHTLV